MGDNRRSPRLEVVALVRGETDDGHSVRVVNAGTGGLLVQSLRRFAPGEAHEFRFTHPDTQSAMVFSARVVHVIATPDDSATGLIGLEFIEPQTAQQRQAIHEVLRLCGAS